MNARILALSTHPDVARMILVGSQEQSTLLATLSEDGMKLEIKVTVSGEFYEMGAEELAKRRLSEFKARLVESIHRRPVRGSR